MNAPLLIESLDEVNEVLEALGIEPTTGRLVNALRPSESQLQRARDFLEKLEQRGWAKSAAIMRDIIARRSEGPTFTALVDRALRERETTCITKH